MESATPHSQRDAGSSCGLYVHIPFCETKCGYCDFFSVAVKDRDTWPLVDRVGRELGQRLCAGSLRVDTVFLGGGTPTVLAHDQLTQLLTSVSRRLTDFDIVEFTVEANPATVDDEKADILRRHGVTRVSMGAQSFLPEELATLERLHSPDDIAPSVKTLRRNGIGQVNLDLIFGIPGQTIETWSRSLRRAIELEPDHVACYGLTYEPNTRLTAMRKHGRLTPIDEQLEADMFLLTIETLAAAGFRQYEISNYARPGGECRHNLNYWRNGPYIGVGPSAAGCINGRRYKNVADVNGYIRMIDDDGHAEMESEIVDTPVLITEMIMMQLRLVQGLSIEMFRSRTGVDPIGLFGETLARSIEMGHAIVSETSIALTRSGQLFADAIITDLAAACDGIQPIALAKAEIDNLNPRMQTGERGVRSDTSD